MSAFKNEGIYDLINSTKNLINESVYLHSIRAPKMDEYEPLIETWGKISKEAKRISTDVSDFNLPEELARTTRNICDKATALSKESQISWARLHKKSLLEQKYGFMEHRRQMKIINACVDDMSAEIKRYNVIVDDSLDIIEAATD